MANVSSLSEPGRPVCRRYIFELALSPLTVTFSALMTTTYPPMSIDGEYSGTVLPL